MPRSYEPGEPTLRDRRFLELLGQRDGQLTFVEVAGGATYRVHNIAWGYDAGDCWSHITTNISPDVPGEDIDFFVTSEVVAVRAADTGEVLLGPA